MAQLHFEKRQDRNTAARKTMGVEISAADRAVE